MFLPLILSLFQDVYFDSELLGRLVRLGLAGQFVGRKSRLVFLVQIQLIRLTLQCNII